MENPGLIIQHLRSLSGLSVRNAAEKLGRSIGWLSEIENNCGTARITEDEFSRVVEALNGAKHRSQFKTWVASHRNQDHSARLFDGAALKFIRIRKGLSLHNAGKLTHLSIGYLSKIETGLKPVSLELRNQIMIAYGYSPSSFKNLSTDPVRSKVVPIAFKLEILMNRLSKEQMDAVFVLVQNLWKTASPNDNSNSK